MPPLELKLMLSDSQALFYTSCQRATHEYVCTRGRSYNLCKVSSCIMQLICTSTGCEYTQECAHTHRNSLLYSYKEVNKPKNLTITSHTKSSLRPNSLPHLCLKTIHCHSVSSLLDLVISVKRKSKGSTEPWQDLNMNC